MSSVQTSLSGFSSQPPIWIMLNREDKSRIKAVMNTLWVPHSCVWTQNTSIWETIVGGVVSSYKFAAVWEKHSHIFFNHFRSTGSLESLMHRTQVYLSKKVGFLLIPWLPVCYKPSRWSTATWSTWSGQNTSMQWLHQSPQTQAQAQQPERGETTQQEPLQFFLTEFIQTYNVSQSYKHSDFKWNIHSNKAEALVLTFALFEYLIVTPIHPPSTAA